MVVEVTDLDMLDTDAPVGEDSSRCPNMATVCLTLCQQGTHMSAQQAAAAPIIGSPGAQCCSQMRGWRFASSAFWMWQRGSFLADKRQAPDTYQEAGQLHVETLEVSASWPTSVPTPLSH